MITRDIAKAALEVYDVDELGLDRLDRAVLSALTRSFGGGPVGVSTLAVAVGEEAATVEEVCVIGLQPAAVAPTLGLARLPHSSGSWCVDPSFSPPRASREHE